MHLIPSIADIQFATNTIEWGSKARINPLHVAQFLAGLSALSPGAIRQALCAQKFSLDTLDEEMKWTNKKVTELEAVKDFLEEVQKSNAVLCAGLCSQVSLIEQYMNNNNLAVITPPSDCGSKGSVGTFQAEIDKPSNIGDLDSVDDSDKSPEHDLGHGFYEVDGAVQFRGEDECSSEELEEAEEIGGGGN
ncbi:hypothetical protein SERLADRAFT_408082 [Serpula lacrymans var. lacrymans S7.9]|nr:uncharacterized protein SERLADRAFT_408082 [Serpula lacrymans var. lacrymans S7.9]EGO25847.1 hypothetical protein SERLADRAFT_408082 [Serpula lacrymans var. lacrymans S7.9]